MPRGTAWAQLTTDAAILPTLRPLPSIEPKQTCMSDTKAHLFPSGSAKVNQVTEPPVVMVPGRARGLAPGQGPGAGASSKLLGQAAGVYFPGPRQNLAAAGTEGVSI